MRYFTRAEAEAAINHSPADLCANSADNPNREAMLVLTQHADARPTDVRWAAFCWYVLGRAAGIREERWRRRQGHQRGRADRPAHR